MKGIPCHVTREEEGGCLDKRRMDAELLVGAWCLHACFCFSFLSLNYLEKEFYNYISHSREKVLPPFYPFVIYRNLSAHPPPRHVKLSPIMLLSPYTSLVFHYPLPLTCFFFKASFPVSYIVQAFHVKHISLKIWH